MVRRWRGGDRVLVRMGGTELDTEAEALVAALEAAGGEE
jgi:hypothetical protein